LPFIQVCSEPALMHCSTAQDEMSSPVFSAALQNRLIASSAAPEDSRLCCLQLHLWVLTVHTYL